MNAAPDHAQGSSRRGPQGEATPVNALLACERARGDAVVAGDLDRLAGLLADDLVYVHAPGQRHDKAQLLDYLRTGPRFLAIDLLNPRVQVRSDCAVVVGELQMRLQRNPDEEPETVRSWVSQVWVRERGDSATWKLHLLQSTRQHSPVPDQDGSPRVAPEKTMRRVSKPCWSPGIIDLRKRT